jgi:FAD/FMN-containing dehydrogenase
VTGLEAVVSPGEVIVTGGGVRKDVAGYDMTALLTGSEGTLGVICSAWLRLIPAPEDRAVVIGTFDRAQRGCAAIEGMIGAGLMPAAIEYLDAGALGAARGAFPFELPAPASFLVIAEVDGSPGEVERTAAEVAEALGEGSLAVHSIAGTSDLTALWRWRDGVSGAVTGIRGGKVSDDIAVPVDRLAEAIEATVEIGARHRLEACSWGHAGDGNIHSTFLVDLASEDELRRARLASGELYALAVKLGGTISGEHGIGTLKRDHLSLRLTAPTIAAERAIKAALDPGNLMNPGKLL